MSPIDRLHHWQVMLMGGSDDPLAVKRLRELFDSVEQLAPHDARDLQQALRQAIEYRESCEEYQRICERIGQPATRAEVLSKKFDPKQLSWMQAYCKALHAGVFPDAATLFYIGMSFARYLQPDLSGKYQSLHEAFGLKPRQREGTPAAVLAREERMAECRALMFEYRRDRKNEAGKAPGKQEAAAYAMECMREAGRPLHIGVDTLVRYVSDLCAECSIDWDLEDEPPSSPT